LASISDDVRRVITPTINKILDSVKSILSSPGKNMIAPAAFMAVKAAARTMCPGEEISLTSCVPVILAAIRNGLFVANAMPVLVPLSCVPAIQN
jgi:hypothetical protein